VKLGLGNEKTRILLQTPALRCPFGVSSFTNAAGDGPESRSLDLSLASDWEVVGTPSNVFLEKLKGIDDMLLDAAVANSASWFNKNNASKELLAEFYRPLSTHRNPEYPPTVRVKIPSYTNKNGEPVFSVFDVDRTKTGIDAVLRGSVVRAIVEVSPIWFLNKTFGITLKLVQCAIVSTPSKLDEFAFVEDEMPVEDDDVPTDVCMIADE